MDEQFRQFAKGAVREFGQINLFDIILVFLKPSAAFHPPLTITPGSRGTAFMGAFILIDEDLPAAKQHVCLYHELGHLDYRRSSTAPFDAAQDEYHACHYCLSRLEAEKRLELLRDELDVIQGHVDAGTNRTDHYPEAFAKLFACSDWNRWVALL